MYSYFEANFKKVKCTKQVCPLTPFIHNDSSNLISTSTIPSKTLFHHDSTSLSQKHGEHSRDRSKKKKKHLCESFPPPKWMYSCRYQSAPLQGMDVCIPRGWKAWVADLHKAANGVQPLNMLKYNAQRERKTKEKRKKEMHCFHMHCLLTSVVSELSLWQASSLFQTNTLFSQ